MLTVCLIYIFDSEVWFAKAASKTSFDSVCCMRSKLVVLADTKLEFDTKRRISYVISMKFSINSVISLQSFAPHNTLLDDDFLIVN